MNKTIICTAVPLYGDSEAAGLTPSFTGTMYVFGNQLDALVGDKSWCDGDVELDPSPYPNCIEHARNNLVRLFLASPRNYTHLLFWDADVKAPTPRILANVLGAMLKADKPFIGAPYAQKVLDFEEAARRVVEHFTDGWTRDDDMEDRRAVEALIRGYSHRYVPDPRFVDFGTREGDLLEIRDHVPIGFGLLKREVLEKMTAHYGEDPKLVYESTGPTGERERHVGLFHTTIGRGAFRMEDVAFCDRWRDMGGRMWLYVGEGTPLEHVGRTSFGGTREALLGGGWTKPQG